jgi:tetratricopeptide (TPR) repeat protein
MLGYSHQSMGQYEVARRCYESAIKLLKTTSGAEVNHAGALENLASLEGLMHQLDAARNLNFKARNLYEKNKNYEGMARIDTWLATIALSRNNVRQARSYLSSAFSEAQLATNQSDGDRAAMYAVDGNIAAHTHDYSHAVMTYQRSIDSWKDASDWEYDVIAWEHALRGDANRELGNFSEAARDFQAALALLERAGARTAPVFFQTEILYARLIRATGDELKAKRMELEAKISLDKLRLGQCDGCSVSVNSFRLDLRTLDQR